MFNTSRSTYSKDSVFRTCMDVFTNLRLSRKNLQLELLEKKYFDLIEELAPKIMNYSLLMSTLWAYTGYKFV